MLHRRTVIEVLGFNPISTEYKFFVVMMTPEMAQYILDNHNFDNRNFYNSQLAALSQSGNTDATKPLTRAEFT